MNDQFWNNLLGSIGRGMTALSLTKIILTIFVLFYLLFSLLIVRQVSLMNEFLETKLSATTKFLSIIYFVITLVILVLVLFL